MELTPNEKRSVALKGKFFPRKNIKYEPRLKTKCPVCGKELSIDSKRSKEYKVFYCKIHNPGNFKKGHVPWNKKYNKLIIKYCTWCGRKLLRKTHDAKVYGNSFCNNQCLGKWLSEKYKSNKYFAGGWRKECIKRDNNTCRLCGKIAEQQGCNMSVDHIIPYEAFHGNHIKATQLANLWCLCKNCHADKSNWEAHFNLSIEEWLIIIKEKYPQLINQLKGFDINLE